jgi:hypothetical protein
MRAFCVTGVMTALVLGLATVASAELTSGPQAGETVGAFTVTKVTGNADDGVDDGKTLCYRCKMGKRPVVMVFARSTDASVAKLVEKLEAEIEEHADAKLSAFVNLIGTDAEALKKEAADFVAKHEITRVAFVVPEDFENGPPEFKIAPEADITVICYKGGEVKANHALAKGGLCCETIDAIVEDSEKLVEVKVVE